MSTQLLSPLALVDERAAEAYAAMLHNPHDYAVRRSYAALEATVLTQWRELTEERDIRVIFHAGTHEYADSAAMRADVADGTLYTRHSVMSGDYAEADRALNGHASEHPMFRNVGVMWEARDRDGIACEAPLTLNDVFRAVHDMFGHYDAGSGFGPLGELRAWLQHRLTMPDDALPALWCETRGQAATYAVTGKFAPQKAGMPEWWVL